jgi:hypothetical protein
VTNIISERGAVPMTVVNTLGEPVTLVNSGGEPVTLFNPNGTLWDYPFSLFSNNEQGAWYDPSDFSTLYQNSTGTTPVTAVEQPVGLMLDRSRGLVLGSELVTNGSFDVDANWGTLFGATISGGKLNCNVSGSGNNIAAQTITGSAGAYVVTLTISGYTTGNLRIRMNDAGTLVSVPASNGTHTIIAFSTTTNPALQLISTTSTTTLNVDEISAKYLPGNHAFQATSASRPVLRSRYNLLTYSEQFDDGAWQKTSLGSASVPTITANAGIAPDGTTTAERAQFARTGTTTVDRSRLLQASIPVSASTNYVFSVWMKSYSGADQTVTLHPNFGNGVGLAVTATSEWQRFSVFATTSGTTAQVEVALGFITSSVTAADILIWGAQLQTAADEAATGGAYQRIAAATDYDTSNPVWRPYLAFDGTDDGMATSSIDFSATDEVTVFAGVHKASDTAAAMLVELSANKNSNAGSFYITAPELTGASGNFGAVFRGSENNIYVASATTLAPVTAVITAFGDISADSQTIRTNGTAVTGTPDMGTGNFGNYPLYIGRRGGATLPLNGRLYSLAVLGRTATAAELSSMEAWVNGKTGAF